MRILKLLAALTLLLTLRVNAQTREVSGKITDQSGAPIPNASIRIKGTTNGSSADAAGNFKLSVKPNSILQISAVGYADQQINIGNRQDITVQMTIDSRALSEVVVTALGVRRQSKELGYATTAVRSAQLNQAAVINPANGLAAKVSGVDIRLADNGINPQVKVTFRGSRSISGNNTALIVVDGVPVDQTYLNNLNPTDIEDITILKGSNAAALYGMSASNGVHF